MTRDARDLRFGRKRIRVRPGHDGPWKDLETRLMRSVEPTGAFHHNAGTELACNECGVATEATFVITHIIEAGGRRVVDFGSR